MSLSLKSLLLAAVISSASPQSECHKNCKISDAGKALIRNFEGYYPFPYKDPIGLDTIGFGHLLGENERLTYPLLPRDAEKLLSRDTDVAGKGVNGLVAISLRQHQFDPLVSFVFNLGKGSLARSTMLKRINAGRHDDVPAEFAKWNKAGGKVFAGLTRRRAAEATMYADD